MDLQSLTEPVCFRVCVSVYLLSVRLQCACGVAMTLSGFFFQQEQQIEQLMRHSGDSSEQLSLMNQQLVEKDRSVCSLTPVLLANGVTCGKCLWYLNNLRVTFSWWGVVYVFMDPVILSGWKTKWMNFFKHFQEWKCLNYMQIYFERSFNLYLGW